MIAANTTYQRLIGELYPDLELEAYKTWGQSGGYAKPTGWTKPTEYSGLKGSVHKAALAKGYLNLGLVDPEKAGDSELAAQVFRNLVRLLISFEGKAEISDPEWTLKQVYPGALIKNVLAQDLQEALGMIFSTEVEVTIKGGTHSVLGGFGWVVSAPKLKKLVKAK